MVVAGSGSGEGHGDSTCAAKRHSAPGEKLAEGKQRMSM